MQELANSSTEPARDSQVVRNDPPWTVEALCSVWERHKARVGERIEVIERAISAIAGDRLDVELRCEAERAAHMLAGSLGMFGFVAASDAASCLEAELVRPAMERAETMRALLSSVRSDIQGPVALLEVPTS